MRRKPQREVNLDFPNAVSLSLLMFQIGLIAVESLRFVWRTPIIVQTMTPDFVATFFASANPVAPDLRERHSGRGRAWIWISRRRARSGSHRARI